MLRPNRGIRQKSVDIAQGAGLDRVNHVHNLGYCRRSATNREISFAHIAAVAVRCGICGATVARQVHSASKWQCRQSLIRYINKP